MTALISVVDDDEWIRKALVRLMNSVGLRVEAFASAEDFLHSGHARDTTCLILDVWMPGMDGLELQRQLAMTQSRIPTIFITSYEDEKVRTQALQAGAVDFLPKPFSEKALLKSLHLALAASRKNALMPIRQEG